jgi:hypothetical protein
VTPPHETIFSEGNPMTTRQRGRARRARPSIFRRFLNKLWHTMRGGLVALSAIGPFSPPPPPPPPPPIEDRDDDGGGDRER